VKALAAAGRRLRSLRHGGDAGFSLMEVIVGMSLMSIFMAVFTGATITMFSSANKVSTVNDTSSQLNNAFIRLDRQVRYASAISREGLSGGNWYVEFRTTNTGATVCSQLKLNPTTQVLQERSWSVTGPTASNLSGWNALASHVSNGAQSATSPDRPFQYVAPTAAAKYQQLAVRLFAQQASSNSPTTALTSASFTLLNSSTVTSTIGVCTEVSRS